MKKYIRSWAEITELMDDVRRENCIARITPLYQVWAERLAQQLENPRNRSLFTLKALRTHAKGEATRFQTARKKCACKQT